MSEQREPREGYIAVGRILKPWGLHGDLKVEPMTDFAGRFEQGARPWLDGQRRRVEHSREANGLVYLKLAGVDTPDDAGALRGLLLEVALGELAPLPAGEYYHHQLTGLTAHTTDGMLLGTVRDVLEPGPNSVFVVVGPLGEILIPYIDDVVRRIDLAAGAMEIEVIEGLLPEPRDPRPERFRRHQTRRRRRAAAQPPD